MQTATKIVTCKHGVNIKFPHLCAGCRIAAEAAEARRKADQEAISRHRDSNPRSTKTHVDKIFDVMADSQWRTLEEIKALIPGSQPTGLSAGLRQLRHAEYGGFLIEKQPREGNVWEYRVLAPTASDNLAPRVTKDVEIKNLKARIVELEAQVEQLLLSSESVAEATEATVQVPL
jgi:hypothetical protein